MKLDTSGLLKKYGLLLVVLGLVAVAAVLSPLFLTQRNLVNLLTQVSFIGIIAVGMTVAILTGGIDLSVGSIVGFSSIFFATMLHGNLFTWMPDEIFVYEGGTALTPLLPLPLNLFVVLLVGALFGLISGTMAYLLKLHPFIITLGMMIFVRGLGLSYTDGQPLFGVPAYTNTLAYGTVLGIPMPVILWIITLAVAWTVLRYTRFGRRIYAVGGEEEAARLSGIQPALYRIAPFVISGLCAAMVGVLMTGRLAGGDPKIAEAWELDAIGAVVIGGTSLHGGKGGVGGTILGVLIVGIVVNVMNLLGIETHPQEMVKGALIVGAVALQNLLGRAAKEPVV